MRLKLVLALGAALTSAATASAAPLITEPVTLPAPGSAIVTGPDGALWVSLPDKPGAVARVAPDGTVTNYPVGGKDTRPTAMAVGPDGALWYVEDGGARGVGRITVGGVVSRFDGLTGQPAAIAVGPDGNLWVTERHADFNRGQARHDDDDEGSAVARVSPTGAVTEFPSGDDDPAGIAAGDDGAMWFTEEESIGRITMAGAVTHFKPTVFDKFKPSGIATGPGGLWFTADKTVGRITTAGVAQGFPIGNAVFDRATAIAAGPDGAVWFTAKDGVGRVTPDGTVTMHSSGLTDKQEGAGIVAGPDGAMWFTRKTALLGRITVPPSVSAVAVPLFDATRAIPAAVVRANAAATTVEMHLRDASQAVVAVRTVSVPPGVAGVPVGFLVTGLKPATTYTTSFTAVSSAGPALPATAARFTTAPAPPATPTPTPTPSPSPAPDQDADQEPAAAPHPVLGEAVILRPASGDVRVKARGQGGFSPLDGATAVPLGALIDTRVGEVRLNSALKDGTTQSGLFRDGLFRVRQGNRGRTNVVLAGRLDCRHKRSSLASVSKRRKSSRRLWGSDSGGSFRTHGRDSVATVRGTEWLTVDRCGGTLTRVKEGAVSVRPKGKGPAKLVRAGERLFVRHR